MNVKGTVTAHFSGAQVLRTYQASNLRKMLLLAYLYGASEQRMVRSLQTTNRRFLTGWEKIPLLGVVLLRRRVRRMLMDIRAGVDK